MPLANALDHQLSVGHSNIVDRVSARQKCLSLTDPLAYLMFGLSKMTTLGGLPCGGHFGAYISNT